MLCGAAACAAGAATVLGATVTADAAKLSQKAVFYQDSPKGDQRCDNCSLFQPPSACKSVDGDVSPSGWCKIYVHKAA